MFVGGWTIRHGGRTNLLGIGLERLFSTLMPSQCTRQILHHHHHHRSHHHLHHYHPKTMKVTMTRHGSSVDKLRMNLALHLQPFKRASSLLVTRFIIVIHRQYQDQHHHHCRHRHCFWHRTIATSHNLCNRLVTNFSGALSA